MLEDLVTAFLTIGGFSLAVVIAIGWCALCVYLGALLFGSIGGLVGGCLGAFILLVFLYFMALREEG